MSVLGKVDADDAFSRKGAGFLLHATHGELTGVVERSRIGRELDVAKRLREALGWPANTDGVDARAHHHADGMATGAHERPKVLAAQVAGEWTRTAADD